MLTGSCATGNPVDDCWRCNPSWSDNRQRIADCTIGFGRNAIGGKNGRIYAWTDPPWVMGYTFVTDPGDDNPVRPSPGTLRYGLVQDEPLWIVFDRDMKIRPKLELVVVREGGACFAVNNVSNVIIHGITHTRLQAYTQGGNILQLVACADSLVDVTVASTALTVSNSLFTNHNKDMLLGHSDAFSDDRSMQVTVAFNRFGPGLVQRMPRCRFGVFHVVNNDYLNWEMYAIGGSASSTILSHSKRFYADRMKEVRFHCGYKTQRRPAGERVAELDVDIERRSDAQWRVLHAIGQTGISSK
ncbi:hypothetical protein ACQ4PT_042785 [Festuca glaucescens]